MLGKNSYSIINGSNKDINSPHIYFINRCHIYIIYTKRNLMKLIDRKKKEMKQALAKSLEYFNLANVQFKSIFDSRHLLNSDEVGEYNAYVDEINHEHCEFDKLMTIMTTTNISSYLNSMVSIDELNRQAEN